MKFINKSLIAGLLIVSSAASFTAQAAGAEAGDWIVRVRAIDVSPTDSSSEVEVGGTNGVGGSFVPGSGVGVSSSVVPELDITYMLTPHWGVELILGMSQHDVDPQGAGLIGALEGLAPGQGSSDIIDVWALPPTLTLQYHFMPESNIRPYAGLGLNYTIFLHDDVTGSLAINGATVNLRPSFGWAAQIGADFDLGDSGWFANIDVKYIDMDTRAEFRGTPVGDVNVDVDIDPIVFGIGIGRRF